MDDQIALILHADVEVYRPYKWKHIEETLQKYKEAYSFFYPIVCYSNAKAKPPESFKYPKYHISLRETGKALQIAKDAGCTNSLVSPALTVLENPKEMMDNFQEGVCFVGSFQPYLYYGGTRNLHRVWTNMPWNPLNDLNSNFKRFFENVFIPSEFANIVSRESVGAVTKEVMSIDLVKEVR